MKKRIQLNEKQLQRIIKEAIEDAFGVEGNVEPKFKVGDIMRTIEEAEKGWRDGMPFIVGIKDGFYLCNSEKIAISDQDEYEYPPIGNVQVR